MKGSLPISDRLASGLRDLLSVMGEMVHRPTGHGLVASNGMTLLCSGSQSQAHLHRVHLSAFALKMLAAQSAILKRFESRNVPALGLKGLSLSLLLFGDLGTREFGDLDIWVPPSRWQDAFECLEELGYLRCRPSGLSIGQELAHVRYGKAQSWVSFESGVQVDLHWRLLSNWIDDDLISFEDAWSRRVYTCKDGLPSWPTLGPEDAVVFLALHGAQDGWNSLKMILDLVQALEVLDLDWDRIDGIAGRRMPLLEKSVDLCLHLVKMTEIRPTRSWFSGYSEALECWRSLLTASNTPQRRLLAPSLWRCGRVERLRRTVWATMTPAIDDIEAVALPPYFVGFYPLVRAVRLVWKTLFRYLTRQNLDPP